MSLYRETPKVDHSEDMALFVKYQQSKKFDEDGKLVSCDLNLRNLLAERNSRLVTFTMNKFFESRKKSVKVWSDLYQDLYQEGQIGLLSAIDGFDPALGFKFGTYATTWIKQAVQRYLGDTCPIAIPSHVKTARNKLLRHLKDKGKTGSVETLVQDATKQELDEATASVHHVAMLDSVKHAQTVMSSSFESLDKEDEAPTPSSGSSDFGFSDDDVRLLDRATVEDIEMAGVPASNLRLVKASLRVRAANFKYLQGQNDTESAISRSLVNEDASPQDEQLDAVRLIQAARKAFEKLSARERCVLLERYGVDSSMIVEEEKE